MAATYSYQSLEEGQIRLLVITKASLPLQCSLVHVPIGVPGEYNALSYTWENSEPTDFVICDGQRLGVTSNLHHALCSISKNRIPWTVWVDGICIDQQNDDEKARQVRCMDTIYSSARTVVVWLGLAKDDSDLAIQAIEEMVQDVKSTDFCYIEERDAARLIVSKQGDNALAIWSSILKLFRRSWFYRLWVIQEVALAREAIITCGDKEISWIAFITFTKTILCEMFSIIIIDNPTLHSLQIDLSLSIPIIDIDNMRQDPQEQDPLLLLLSVARRRFVTDPRDRIYGMLGLASKKDQSLITIDYAQDYVKVYRQFSISYLKSDHTLDLLCLASSEQRPPELPTWCPNFNSAYPEGYPFCAISTFRAGYISSIPRLAYIDISESSNEIALKGFRSDVVKKVVLSSCVEASNVDECIGPEGTHAKNLNWLLECESLFFQCTPQSVEVSEAYCQALIAENFVSGPAPEELHPAYHIIKEMFSEGAKGVILHKDVGNYGEIVMQYMYTMDYFCNRRFFCTEGGRFGLGPKNTKPGDVVCVLYGGGPLFLLRPIEESTKFNLVGDAYVSGLMNLEKTKTEISCEDEMFVIA